MSPAQIMHAVMSHARQSGALHWSFETMGSRVSLMKRGVRPLAFSPQPSVTHSSPSAGMSNSEPIEAVSTCPGTILNSLLSSISAISLIRGLRAALQLSE